MRVLLAGGELPGTEMLKTVSDILNADNVRPLTDHVTVAALKRFRMLSTSPITRKRAER